MRSTATTRPSGVARTQLAIVAVAAILAVWATLATAIPAAAQGELTIQKYVASVNDAAPVEPVSVVEGDTVSYGLAVSGSAELAGTSVTVVDVFGANQLDFQNASVGGCVEDANQVSCTVVLDDAAGAEVVLTFVVLPLEGNGEGCRSLSNTARVDSAEGATATSHAQIDVCPGVAAANEAGAPAASAETGNVAAGATGAVAGGSGGPGTAAGQPGATADTAVALPSGIGAALLVQLGVVLVGTGAFALAHAPLLRGR
jgi:hypothetical protein